MTQYSCLLLTDSDEKLQEIRHSIDWTKNEVKEIFASCNQEDESELGILYHPDIIILDLDCDFTELIGKISAVLAVSPQSHFIAYINYSDFTFDETFVALETVDFLARPISAALNLNVARIVHDMDSYQKKKYSAEALNGLLNEYIPIIRQHYLSMILHQPIPESENVMEKFKTLHIDCPGPYYTVIVIDVSANRRRENFEAVNFLLLSSVKKAIQAAHMQCYIFFDADFEINCLVGTQEEKVSGILESILDSMNNQFEHLMQLSLKIGIGKTVCSAREIYCSFDDAVIALQSLLQEDSGIASFSNIEVERQLGLKYDRLVSQVAELFFSGEQVQFESALWQTMEQIRQSESLSGERRFAVKFIVFLANNIDRMGIDVTQIASITDFIPRLLAATNGDSVRNSLAELNKRLSRTRSNEETQRNYLMEKALTYINDNLSDAKLTLETVSNHVSLSRTYFCKLFREYSGEYFSNFVRKQRIEYAKDLLTNTNMYAYEIADKVGFTSAKYFSYSFKQITGMTPAEYQNNYAK